MSEHNALTRLAAGLGRLPGIGRKTAERLAMALARDPEGVARSVEQALHDVRASIRSCERCGSMTPVDENPCRLCTDASRDDNVLCVVEDPSAILAVERSGGFRGRYHALMGKLSPMEGEGPAQLRSKELVQRVEAEEIQEVVLALDTDVDSDATASFVAEQLHSTGVRVTRLAFGLPSGSGIAYSDPVTLAKALDGRRPVA